MRVWHCVAKNTSVRSGAVWFDTGDQGASLPYLAQVHNGDVSQQCGLKLQQHLLCGIALCNGIRHLREGKGERGAVSPEPLPCMLHGI